MTPQLQNQHQNLVSHPVYNRLTTINNIKTFMSYHVFAVWDFMSLLKALQRDITGMQLPWTSSKYNPELVRLVNEIVLAEESDLDQNGVACSHFELYLRAMDELGADRSLIDDFLLDFELAKLPKDLQVVLAFNLNTAFNGKAHEVAAAFFYGREKLIPEMFESIVRVMKRENLHCPTLLYYLERHIEIDAEEHGPKAQQCLIELTDTPDKSQQAIEVATKSLQMRDKLWNFIESQLS